MIIITILLGGLIGFVLLRDIAVPKVLPESLQAEWFYLHKRDDYFDIATAFATALRLNHQVAYEISDPQIWPYIDEWMKTHTPHECDDWIEEIRGAGGSVFYTCFVDNDFFMYSVDNIHVRNLYVTGWEKVVENEQIWEGPSFGE